MIARGVLWMLRHERLVLAATALAVIAGFVSLSKTPVDALPDLSENQVLVYTSWPGQQPAEIEQRVSRPLSTALQNIPGLVSIRGSSEFNFSLLHLLFDDNVSFVDARQKVKAKLESIELNLPANVRPQLAADGIPTGQIFWYTVEGNDTDLVELRRVQDEIIAPSLRTLTGIAEVASVGGFTAEYELRVEVEQLSRYQLGPANLDSLQIVEDSDHPESTQVTLPSGEMIALDKLGTVALSTAPRRGIFEKDGSEVVAGIVHLRYGHNTLEVTRNTLDRLQQIAKTLPPNIRVVPCYDRTSLISGAVWTVTGTLLESMLVTSLCVVLILRHWRTSLVITLTLPLAVLGAFLAIWLLRVFGVVDIQANIMSLAGIVVSIGVLVDSAIVITDNVSHQLRERFGDEPIAGDTQTLVAQACTAVGWPAFLAILLMLVSFLPVFALEGIDGRMYRPLAWTKALSLASVALLTLTVVPILCHRWIRGRIRAESESRVVQGFVTVYRPMLEYLLDHPLPLIVILAVTLVLGAAATGIDLLVRIMIGLGLFACWYTSRSLTTRLASCALLLIFGLMSQTGMRPISLSLRVPLDEGMLMDMPITVPNISIAQASDDLKARNMVLCRFPEVAMVTGKAGRAETAFDPAPLDMIETMVELRPTYLWPRRRLALDDAAHQAEAVIKALENAKLVEPSENMEATVQDIVTTALPRFDAVQREVCWQRIQVMQNELGRELSIELVREIADRLWQSGSLQASLDLAEVRGIASELAVQDIKRLGRQIDRVSVHTLLQQILAKIEAKHVQSITKGESIESLISRYAWICNLYRALVGTAPITLAEEISDRLKLRAVEHQRKFIHQLNRELQQRASATWTQLVCSELVTRRAILDESLRSKWSQVLQVRYGASSVLASGAAHQHTGIPPTSRLPIIDPHRAYDRMINELIDRFAGTVWLRAHDRRSLTEPSGELDAAVTMPGWANVWTRPIQNRVDMLASGVNSEVGVRVMGDDLNQIVEVSESIAEVLQTISGVSDVFADPIRGKDYKTWRPDPDQWKAAGLSDVKSEGIAELAEHGFVIGYLKGDKGRLPLRLRVSATSLDEMGRIEISSGPATIKSENGHLRNYVRLNTRDRDPGAVVADAKRELNRLIKLPDGITLEWTGQYEHAARTRSRMLWLIPIVVVLMGIILFAVFRDAVDSFLMLMSVPGALAGGALCQWLLGEPFSVAVGVGYIACFGMAAATSMIMLIYLRESLARTGDLTTMSDSQLRLAVINGAVHRLRPKLLTEATMIFSLAPMLWSDGPGADVIRPMAAPVLGGILVADEVVDLFIPILFYHTRKHRRELATHSTNSIDNESSSYADIR